MQKFFVHRAGAASRRTSSARVSAQKVHTGRSIWEKVQKKITAPPRAPSTMKPRSSPSPRRSRNKNAAAPTIRQ